MNSLVFLQEEQIRLLYNANQNLSIIVNGSAYCLDNYTVIHAFTSSPQISPSGVFIRTNASGILIKAIFIICHSVEEFNTELTQEILNVEIDKLIVKFYLNDRDVLVNKAVVYVNSIINQCKVNYVPEKSELFSRSSGLLETAVLELKKVGIIGLGSGGSPIAIELAKAGVGKFVLIDFDRIELSNIARHVCGINDIGRYKTFAVKDYILQKNPQAEVSTFEIDVLEDQKGCRDALADVDIIICASDNDKSRFFLNDLSLFYKVPAIFGRAITRAIGGDVLRVRPYAGPCYNCLYSQDLRDTEEEVSQKERQAKKFLPDYTSEENLNAVVQVGLASDIAPITNFMVKLALVELSRNTNSGISSLEQDLVADFYIWANRREYVYEDWSKFEYNFNKPSILRWYGARVERDSNCMACGF